MSDTQSIIEKIKNAAKSNGYQLTDNVEKIARAKKRLLRIYKMGTLPLRSGKRQGLYL